MKISEFVRSGWKPCYEKISKNSDIQEPWGRLETAAISLATTLPRMKIDYRIVSVALVNREASGTLIYFFYWIWKQLMRQTSSLVGKQVNTTRLFWILFLED